MQISQKVVYQQLTKNFTRPKPDDSSNQPVDQFNQPVFNTQTCIYDQNSNNQQLPSLQLPTPNSSTNESALLGLNLNDEELNPNRLIQVQSASLSFNNPTNNNFYIQPALQQPQSHQQQQQQQTQYRIQPQQNFHFDSNNNYHGQFTPPILNPSNDYYNSFTFTPNNYKFSNQGSYLCKPIDASNDFGSQFQSVISFNQQQTAANSFYSNNNNSANSNCFMPASNHCFDPSDCTVCLNPNEPKHSQSSSASLNPQQQCDTPPPIITKSSTNTDLLCYNQAKTDDCIEIIAKTGQELSDFAANNNNSNTFSKSSSSCNLYNQASMDPLSALNESSDVSSSAYYPSIDASYSQQCYQNELKQPAFYHSTQDYFASNQPQKQMEAELNECAQVNYYHDLGNQQQAQGNNIFNSLMSMLNSSNGTNQSDIVYPMCQTQQQQQQINSRIKNTGFGLVRNLGMSKNSAFQQYMPNSSSTNGFNNNNQAGFVRSGAQMGSIVGKVKPQMSEVQQDLRFTDSRAKEWCMNSHPRLSTTLLSYSGADSGYGFSNGSDINNNNSRKSKLSQTNESFQSFQPRHVLNKADLQSNEIILNDAHV